MKHLCRTCHDRWCTAPKDDTYSHPSDPFWSGECEKCGKFVEIAIYCSHYDWRDPATVSA